MVAEGIGMRSAFWNHQEARLRAGWRVLLVVVAASVASTTLSGPGRRLLTERLPSLYASLVESLTLVALVAVILWLAARWLDRRRFADYGFHLGRAWWLDLTSGLILGAVLVSGAYVLLLGTGWLRISETFVSPEELPFIPTMLIDVLIVVGVAGWEELVFRGYLVKNVAEGLSGVLGTRWGAAVAVLVPAAFFGWLHASNADATLLSVVNIAIFGILFGVAYVLTGELALPLGLHLAWDFTQGFGFGRSPDPSALGTFLLVEEGDAGARPWTGWPSGFEGGLVATAMLALAFVLILAWVRYRRGILQVQPSVTRAPVRTVGR
jgi:membrane protease YdiL (CAAX protease family)